MNNPYISRGPVRNPEMFFGRTQELQEIAAFLAGNQSVSIVGPRKIGKTSLLFQLLRPEAWAELGLGENNIFVYLDCEVLAECQHDEIFAQFATSISDAIDERKLPPEPFLEEVIAHPSRLGFERAVRKLNQRNLRVVIILDEFERLSTNTRLDVNFFNALRSAAGRYLLAFVTASARPLIQLTFSSSSQEILSSPFFNIFAPLFLGLLSEKEARGLIRKPAQAAGITFTQEVEDFIFNLAGGSPLALQVACFYAFDQTHTLEEVERHTAQEMALTLNIAGTTSRLPSRARYARFLSWLPGRLAILLCAAFYATWFKNASWLPMALHISIHPKPGPILWQPSKCCLIILLK